MAERVLKRRIPGLIGIAALVATGALLVWWFRSLPAGDPRPNLVLITMDTTRADHLPFYGYFRTTSPNLERFAAQALILDRFIVPMATTLPVHMSLFTGTWPDENGFTANASFLGRHFVPTPLLVPVAQALHDKGYSTAAFVSSSPLKASSGIASGFDTFDEPASEERTAALTTQPALDWMHSATPPFFLWIHYFEPHFPYEPSSELYTTDADLQSWNQERRIERPRLDAINRYDSEIHQMDSWIGRVLQALDAREDVANTMVVVAGDHGEGLGQHGWGHHGHIWNEQLHAPLLMRASWLTPRRVDTLLSASDVFPTLFGSGPFPDMSAWISQASGHDILASGFEERPVLSRTSMRAEQPKRKMRQPILGRYALTSRRWKYIRDEQGKESLYDLSKDPHEIQSVAAEYPRDLASLREQMDAVVRQQRARAVVLGSGATKEADPEAIRELEALGYIEAEGN